jgi:hypothetical protein
MKKFTIDEQVQEMEALVRNHESYLNVCRTMVEEGKRPIEVMEDVERRLPCVKAILETLKWLQKNRDAVVTAKMTGKKP